jgi:hypothetical protein
VKHPNEHAQTEIARVRSYRLGGDLDRLPDIAATSMFNGFATERRESCHRRMTIAGALAMLLRSPQLELSEMLLEASTFPGAR